MRFDGYAQARLDAMRIVLGHRYSVLLLLVVTIQAEGGIGFSNQSMCTLKRLLKVLERGETAAIRTWQLSIGMREFLVSKYPHPTFPD